MASITLTLTDTPSGSVSIHSSFKPAVGAPCSPAQAAALEMISRTHKQWGVESTDAEPAARPRADVMGALLACRPPSFCSTTGAAS